MSKIIVELNVGGRQYKVGGRVLDREIAFIKMDDMYFTGDPYSHYCVYSKNDELLASINCLVPCEVIYG